MTKRLLPSIGTSSTSSSSRSRISRFDPNRRLLLPRVKDANTNVNTNLNSSNHHGTSSLPPHVHVMTRKRKRPLKQLERKRELQKYEHQIREAHTEQWLKAKAQFPSNRWTIEQRRALKRWFDQIDRDGSGEIDVDELADPLMSSGLAKTMSEVNAVFQRLDSNNSGGVGYEEFLSVMKSDKKDDDDGAVAAAARERNRGRQQDHRDMMMTATNPIVQLAQKQNGDGHLLDVDCILSQERRKRLLDATMLSIKRREQAHEQIRKWRAEMKKMEGGSSTFQKRMHDISNLIEHMENDRVEKENFVITMRDVLARIRSGQDFSDEAVDRGVNKQVAKFHQSLMRSRNASILRSRKGLRSDGRRTMIFARKSSIIF